MPADDALRFAERLVSLIDSGRKSATYKLATILALIDVAAERTTVAGPPRELSGREVAARVVELYWPQTVPFASRASDAPRPLRQSPQNDIPAKLAAWRTAHGLGASATLVDAERADPEGWRRLRAELTATVIGMPLAKLQRFGEGRTAVEDRFIYDFSWPDEVKRNVVDRPTFDDTIRLRPSVGDWLIRLAPLIRPLVQSKWSELVARCNTDVLDVHQLDEWLFGASRISLVRVRAGLLEVQRGSCFYCGRKCSNDAEVDHFLPWSRHPDDSIDNLVAAHRACNNAKSASIAGVRHLERWTSRLGEPDVAQVAVAAAWPQRADKTASAVAATYLWLPEGTRLWVTGHEYESVDRAAVEHALASVA